ncbi:ABC transporter substrate-binding protein [Massilia sp. TSP1-1-2]|uniref:ABC transporter substrate-binding protein n=1 Tax=unclassified Massilia TaxID=2609279 RepID=UPI003CF3B238
MLRIIRSLLVVLVCMHSTFAQAQASQRPFKIMMLLYRGQTEAEVGFMDYFKKQKIDAEFIIRDAQADRTKIADFVREAKEIKPDLIYTFGTTVTTEVVGLQNDIDPRRHITTIPVVFNIVADPVGAGLVKNLTSSSRNLTGASHLVPLAAQLKALQAMRATTTMGVIYSPQEKNAALAVQELKVLAPKFKLTLDLVPVPANASNQASIEGLRQAIAAVIARKPQFIYLPSDSFLIKNANLVVQAASEARIPVFSATETPIRTDGALLGLVSTYYNVGELAAHKAALILQKKKQASEIPVEVLHRFTYLVNMGTAKKLQIYPPLSILKIAEVVAPLDQVDARE